MTLDYSYQRDGLTIISNYTLTGDLARVLFPKANTETPSRMTGLWETTCFELFLKNKTHSSYIEFNFAPNGNWNAFQFKEYRTGMSEYNGLDKVLITLTRGQKEINLRAIVHLKERRYFMEEDFVDGNIKLGPTAVIEDTQNNKSYWATKHFTKKPDFHFEDNFGLLAD